MPKHHTIKTNRNSLDVSPVFYSNKEKWKYKKMKNSHKVKLKINL
jgi:hypothetical protein